MKTVFKNRNCCIFSILGFAFGLKQKKHSGGALFVLVRSPGALNSFGTLYSERDGEVWGRRNSK